MSTENEGVEVTVLEEGSKMVEEVLQYTPTRELTFARLIEEVKNELIDGRYLHLTHGKIATYNKGCRGHLCTYINRTRQRIKRQEAALAKLPSGVVPDTRSRQEQYWDDIICQIIEIMEDVRDELARHSRLLQVTVNVLPDAPDPDEVGAS